MTINKALAMQLLDLQHRLQEAEGVVVRLFDAPNPYHFTHHEPGIPMVGCPGCLIDQLDSALDRTMAQRDQYHEVADKLAGAIAAHMREEIGEHSSANNPWANALQLIEGSYCR